VHTVVETRTYIAAAEDVGMTDEERVAIVSIIAADPQVGAVMPGCGGGRKLRVKKPGSGKSGGYRVITYYGGDALPVFLLTVFGKTEKASLTKAERNALAKLTATLADGLKRR
jgi:hypothetical protein